MRRQSILQQPLLFLYVAMGMTFPELFFSPCLLLSTASSPVQPQTLESSYHVY